MCQFAHNACMALPCLQPLHQQTPNSCSKASILPSLSSVWCSVRFPRQNIWDAAHHSWCYCSLLQCLPGCDCLRSASALRVLCSACCLRAVSSVCCSSASIPLVLEAASSPVSLSNHPRRTCQFGVRSGLGTHSQLQAWCCANFT